jgi:para-nitrobenzyl esterase
MHGQLYAFSKKMPLQPIHYRIDTSNIFMSGSSAGAVLAMHYIALDAHKPMPAYIQRIIDNNGGFDGNLGYPGPFFSGIKAAVSLAGGINKLEWLDAQDEPVCLVHGELDVTIPFYFDQVFREPPYNLFQLATIHGSGNIHPHLNALGVHNVLLSYPDEGHTPWDHNTGILMEVDTFVRKFLLEQVCSAALTGFVAEKASMLKVYPVPSRNKVVVDVQGLTLNNVSLTDMMGREIWSAKSPAGNITIDVTGWPAGIYLLQGMDSHARMVTGKIVVD